MEDVAISAAYTWGPRPSAQLKVPQPPDTGGWEGMLGKASSYNVPVSHVLPTCEWLLPEAGYWTS